MTTKRVSLSGAHDAMASSLTDGGGALNRCETAATAEIIACQGPPVCILEGDEAIAAAQASRGEGQQQWRDIATAPKDGTVIMFFARQHRTPNDEVFRPGYEPVSGYWDTLDQAWCCTGSTWIGPFYEPTHWQPLPAPPAQE